MSAIYWDHYNNHIIFLNLLIVIGLFASLRLFSGIISPVNATRELLVKDNPAFGISLAAVTLALSIMLSGTIYGSPENDTASSIMNVGVVGLIGIAMLALTRKIFDRFLLTALDLRAEITAGNKAVAIADAGNVIASAIVIRAIMIWADTYSTQGLMALAGGYAVSQLILTALTLGRMEVFRLLHKTFRLQDELRQGNIALALRFSGRKIGTAFAIATAAHIVVYEEYDIGVILASWFAASVCVIIAWKIVCFVAEKLILFRVDTRQEVVGQKNIAVGALQAVIYIALGFLISAL